MLLSLTLQDIRQNLADTAAEGAPVVVTDAVSGRGLTELIDEIQAMAATLPMESAQGMGRLNVDRSFSIKGFGTPSRDPHRRPHGEWPRSLALSRRPAPAHPQYACSHEQDVLRADPPQRTALNLAGISCGAIHRGDVLCTAPDFTATRMIDVKVTCLADAQPLFLWQRMLRLLVGTREVMARIVPLGAEQTVPGTEGFLQLRLEQDEIYVKAGDRSSCGPFRPCIP